MPNKLYFYDNSYTQGTTRVIVHRVTICCYQTILGNQELLADLQQVSHHNQE